MNNKTEEEPIFRGIVYTGNWFELLTEWAKALEEKNKKNE